MSFDHAARQISNWCGTWQATLLACAGILIWTASGFVVGFTDTFQLIINTITTIITFLMVFIIQNTQNRDSTALHIKLDELIRVSTGRNSMIGLEDRTAKDLAKAKREVELEC